MGEVLVIRYVQVVRYVPVVRVVRYVRAGNYFQNLLDFPDLLPKRSVYLSVGNKATPTNNESNTMTNETFTKIEALTIIIKVIRKNGYISRTKAETQFGCSSTGEIVERILRRDEIGRVEEFAARGMVDEADDLHTIKTMIEWGKKCGDGDENSYLSKLSDICNMQLITFGHLGFLASLPSAWKRATERQFNNANCIHIGNIGTALEVSAELLSVRELETRFGTTYLCKLVTTCDNGMQAPLTWFASRKPEIAEGTNVTLKGKVKGHDDTYGIATVVTRCRLTPTKGN
jgi:hypothetical protein